MSDDSKKQLHLNIEYVVGLCLIFLNLYFYSEFKYTEELRQALLHLAYIFSFFLVCFNVPILKNYSSHFYVMSHIFQIAAWSYLPIQSNYDTLSMAVYVGSIISVISGFLQINSAGVYFYPICIFISLFFFRNFEIIMTSSIFSLCAVVILGFRYFLRKQKQVLSGHSAQINAFNQSRDYFYHTLLNPLNLLNGKLQLASMNKLNAMDSCDSIKKDLQRIREEINNFSINDPMFKEHKLDKDNFLHQEYRNLKRILSNILCLILILSLFLFKGFSGVRLEHNIEFLIIIALPLILYSFIIHSNKKQLQRISGLFIVAYNFIFFLLIDKIVSHEFSYICKLGTALICINILSFHKKVWFYLGATSATILFAVNWGLPFNVLSVSFVIYVSLMSLLEMRHERHVIESSRDDKDRNTPEEFVESLREELLPKVKQMEEISASMCESNADISILELKSMTKSLSESIKERN